MPEHDYLDRWLMPTKLHTARVDSGCNKQQTQNSNGRFEIDISFDADNSDDIIICKRKDKYVE